MRLQHYAKALLPINGHRERAFKMHNAHEAVVIDSLTC